MSNKKQKNSKPTPAKRNNNKVNDDGDSDEGVNNEPVDTTRKAKLWDDVAARVSPLEVDSIWHTHMEKYVDNDEKALLSYILLRKYLKVLIKVVAYVYNFGEMRWRFTHFTLPEVFLERWRRLNAEERKYLFTQCRFMHVDGFDEKLSCGAACTNSFVMMCDLPMLCTIGQLDTMFVARHGVQVDISQIKVREATPAEALKHLEAVIATDSAEYARLPASDTLKVNLGYMLALFVSLRKEIAKPPPAPEPAVAAAATTTEIEKVFSGLSMQERDAEFTEARAMPALHADTPPPPPLSAKEK